MQISTTPLRLNSHTPCRLVHGKSRGWTYKSIYGLWNSGLGALETSDHGNILVLPVMSSSKQQNTIVAGTSQGNTTIDVHKLLSKK